MKKEFCAISLCLLLLLDFFKLLLIIVLKENPQFSRQYLFK